MTPHDVDLDARIRSLEAEAEANPSPRTYAPLTEAYRISGRLDRAVETGMIGVRAYPDHAAIHIVLARSLEDSGDRDGAREEYGRALTIDPGCYEARAFLEAALHSEAARTSGIAQTPVGARDASCLPAGDGAAEAGTADEGAPTASPDGENEVAQGQDEPRAERRPGTLSEELAHLADLFARPLAETDETVADEPAGIATLTLAEIYARQGLYEEAAQVCERILERDPENERVKVALSDYRRRPAPVQR